jgi:hypothetical protein
MPKFQINKMNGLRALYESYSERVGEWSRIRVRLRVRYRVVVSGQHFEACLQLNNQTKTMQLKQT